MALYVDLTSSSSSSHPTSGGGAVSLGSPNSSGIDSVERNRRYHARGMLITGGPSPSLHSRETSEAGDTPPMVMQASQLAGATGPSTVSTSDSQNDPDWFRDFQLQSFEFDSEMLGMDDAEVREVARSEMAWLLVNSPYWPTSVRGSLSVTPSIYITPGSVRWIRVFDS